MNKRGMAGLLGTLVLSITPVLVVGSSTSADAAIARAGCVSKAEFNAVRKGWRESAVHDKFGTVGKRVSIATSGGYSSELRTYQGCGSSFNVVSVAYNKKPGGVFRLAAKSAVWVD